VLVIDLVQLCFSLPEESADAVANILTEDGGGIEQRDTETLSRAEDDHTELVVWLPSDMVEARVKQVETLLSSLEKLDIKVNPWSWKTIEQDGEASPEAWQDAYQKYFQVNHIGRFIVIKPSWKEYEPKAQERVIELDPGMAFGTGLHASTVLMIHAMERLARRGPSPKSVLDLGTGTGILSLTAARFWPNAEILALDNDETAVAACLENVEANDLQEQITVKHLSAREICDPYSLVLANLTAPLLADLKPMMRGMLSQYGRLILSGILAEERDGLCLAYGEDLTLEPEYTEELDGWSSILLRVIK